LDLTNSNASAVSQTRTSDPDQDKLDELFENCLALMNSEDLAHVLVKKTTDFVNFINASGRLWTWRSMNYQMNSGLYYGGSLGRSGAMGELVNFPVNIFANLVEHVYAMTTQNKIEWEPAAVNADFDSEAQTTLAKGILESYQRTLGLDTIQGRQILDMEIFGEGHVLTTWRKNGGEMVTADPETKTVKMTGDVWMRNVIPLQVIRDPYITDFADNQWFVVVVLENKFDLMKEYPDCAEDIEQIQSDRRTGSPATFLSPNTAKTDMIAISYFIHKKSLTLPFGRMMKFVDEATILEDGHLPTEDFPLDTMMVRDSRLTNFGYTPFFDILVLQRMFDVITNAIATNITAFSTINVLVPDGADFSPSDVTGGMNFIKFKPLPGGAGEPKALVLLATPKEAYSFLDWIEQRMQKLAGLSDVITGINPDTGANGPDQSGEALALRATQSIQFNTIWQRPAVLSLENKGNILLGYLQKFATEDRLGLIAGNMDKAYVTSFKNTNINKIHRVTVNVGNPLSQTASGRLQLAMLYNSMGITDPHTIAEVIQTGNLQTMTAGPMQEMLSIKKEIEMLRAGKKPIPLLTQNHLLHIQQIQLNVLNDPEFIVDATTPGSQGTALDAQIVQNSLGCMQQHIQLWKQLSMESPELVAALKLPNISGQGGPAPKPGAPGAGAPKTENPALNESAHNQPQKPPNGGTPS